MQLTKEFSESYIRTHYLLINLDRATIKAVTTTLMCMRESSDKTLGVKLHLNFRYITFLVYACPKH